ncbi:MAG: Asp-tRNA(Asn)/Glu-tRNA(Gln) amidotransferase subunit GatC [Patescibacteria group bacterium]|nr:Asp-tRNA(Asn)/Glu-tRNA(Gln) amidotransferase subunit GatC [Patescibacteria group bacterium]MDD5490656.1 Asp-tRNA(Asn)/Glu-tRNA(Gln) amidotransferase subunit GatC [Patescibacteria group bacterium]
MKLTKLEVEKIAGLAKIDLTDAEKKRFQKELSSILTYIGKLNEVDTKDVEPTYQVTGLRDVWREDAEIDCGKNVREGILSNMPERQNNYLKVPAVFKERNKK